MKQKKAESLGETYIVAPHAGAWIETTSIAVIS